MNANAQPKARHLITHSLWSLLAYGLPTVGATAIAICWFGYCFLIPFAFVEINVNPSLPVPEAAVRGPWEKDPDIGIERRRCNLDWPFARFTIVEPRDATKWRKEVWGDPKWLAIVLATLAGILVCGVGWNLWLRLLRKATRDR